VSDLRPLHQKLPDKPTDAGSAADRDTDAQVVYRTNNDQTPANRGDLQDPASHGDLRDPTSRARRECRVDSAGRLNGLRGTPPVSGRIPAGLADQNGSRNNSYCPSQAALASYRKQSRLARSIRTLEGSTPPLRQKSLIFRGLVDHATHGHRPAWLRLSMLGK